MWSLVACAQGCTCGSIPFVRKFDDVIGFFLKNEKLEIQNLAFCQKCFED
ncbi:hypothetical protein Syun_030138 [Stephania yunnanensis]|uniref:Uncharacterized protein n=1 Tax=Stephania yunnanensis TaxID=152371 RepID=A0AAP0EFA0_9MAGN